MSYPPLLNHSSEDDYRIHFENIYCTGPTVTFDGISVRFRKKQFDHSFFESVSSKDDTFSRIRAERMDWIKAALQDPNSDRYIGWDNKRKRYSHSRRVTLVMGNYVVVIVLTGANKADFVTAFVANTAWTLQKIKRSPPWP